VQLTFGFALKVSTAGTLSGTYSTLQPYAIGVNLTTVCNGTCMYGSSSVSKIIVI